MYVINEYTCVAQMYLNHYLNHGRPGESNWLYQYMKKILLEKDIESSFQGTLKNKVINIGFLIKKLGIYFGKKLIKQVL